MKRKVEKIEVIIEGCEDHPKGCYIRFSGSKVHSTKNVDFAFIDYDRNGDIVGIEFPDGLQQRHKKRKLR